MTQRLKIREMKASLYFGGTAYVQLPAIATSSAISVSAWIKTPTNVPSGSIDILGRSAGTSDLFEISTTGQIRFNVATSGGTNNNLTRTNLLTKNKWHHIVATLPLSTGVSKIYLDGALVGSNTSGSGTFTNNANTWIIGALTSATRNFTGNICHVGIWDAELSASEIDILYSNGTIPRQDLCVAYYPLEEGGGSSVYDKFNRATVGTIISATFTNDVPVTTRQKVNANLVRNGDFSYVPPFVAATTASGFFIDGTASGSSTNSLFGWALQFAGTMSARFDKSNPYNGKPSLKVSATATGTNAEVGVLPTNTAANVSKFSIRLVPGAQYLCSFWMKTNYISGDSAGGAGMEFVERDSNGTAVVTNATTKIKTSTEWTKYTLTFTANPTQTFLAPRMRVQGNTGAATLIMDAWFADIQIYPTTAVARTVVAPGTRQIPRDTASSLSFTGSTSNNVSVPYTFPTDAFTIMFDISAKAPVAASQYILTQSGSLGIFRQGVNDIQLYAYLNAPNDYASGPRRLRFRNFYYPGANQNSWPDRGFSNEWQHKAYVIYVENNSAKCDEYLNGAKVGSTHTVDYAGDSSTPSGNFFIGNINGVSANSFNGFIKNVRIFNKKITSSEINTVYKTGKSSTSPDLFLPLDEGAGTVAYDRSDSKNNGTVSGAVYAPTAPISFRQRTVSQNKSSLYFDGASKVNLSKTVPVSTGITYSAWIKPNGVANQRILGLNNNSNIRLDTNKKVLFVLFGVVEYPSNTTIEAGKWTHVAATYDKQNVKIYINGVLNSVNAQTAAFPASGTLIEVGSYTGTAQFLGKITDCKIWTNKVLTGGEISELYLNNKYSRNNLLVEYLFNEGSGSTTIDTSDNKNNGTITGAVYTNDVPN